MNILNIYNELDSHNFDLNVDHYGAEQCDKGYSFGPTIMGYSIKDYILQVKMNRSCQLLEDSARSITEIAYSVGYQDPLTFSAAFKNYFHMSPSDFRKTQKSGKEYDK